MCPWWTEGHPEASPDEDLANLPNLTDLLSEGTLIFKLPEVLEKMGLPSDADRRET